MINKLSTGILDGTHGLLIFDGVYSLILSIIYLIDNDASIFQYHYFIFSPILMNKFYYFTLIYFCISFSESKKKFELISGSTLISIYLLIWNFIISLFRDLSSLNELYITQIVFASIPSLCVAIFIIVTVFKIVCSPFKGEFPESCVILLCLCAFLVCFGGFWIDIDTNEENSDSDCDCHCCIDCCNHCCCLECIYYLCEKCDYCDWCGSCFRCICGLLCPCCC